jgi:fructan beta-fructosidase
MRPSSKAVGLGLVLTFFAFVLVAFYFRSPNLLFPNSDFENGDLAYWNTEGLAFIKQPTYGDNPWYRDMGSANLTGNFWVGTAEFRRTANDRGMTHGDGPMGKLISDPFVIRHPRISFYVGAGDGSELTGVALVVDGKQVMYEPGRGSTLHGDRMRKHVWNVSRWMGREARIVVLDQSRGRWGHINVDDFRWS